MLKNAAAALALSFMSLPAFGQGQNCHPTMEVYTVLSEQHGESRYTSGFGNQGLLVEMWGNRETGTWTALVTHPEGYSCVVASGSFFTVEDEPEPAGMRL